VLASTQDNAAGPGPVRVTGSVEGDHVAPPFVVTTTSLAPSGPGFSKLTA
jgi:hypothetical protein